MRKRTGKTSLPYLPALESKDGQKLQVLVAEADTPDRAGLVRLLTRDCQVVCAETVRRAQWLVQRYHFDLVICDLELPLSGGIALLPYIEMLSPETMSVLLTAQADRQLARVAFRYGAFDCYVKPLTEETIGLLLYVVRNGSPNWQ
jgi:DNA-binding NtrC family response regulator